MKIPHEVKIIVLVVLTVLTAVFLYIKFGTFQDNPNTQVVTNEPVTLPKETLRINTRTMMTTTLRHGFLNGPNHYAKRDSTTDTASKLLDALEPGTWRFSGVGTYGYGGDIHGFVVQDYQYHSRFGTNIVVNLQDIFMAKYGWPVTVRPLCFGSPGCFTSFEKLQASWKNSLQEFLLETSDIHIDYFDLLAEVDLGGFENVSWDQMYILMKDAHALVREYRPDAKTVAPSNAGFSPKIYEELIKRISEDEIRLDAISWHELGDDPGILSSHVDTLKSFFELYPTVCDPKCPEIHINEYQGENFMLVPGHVVGWLHALEASRVDQANRACWGGDPGTPIPYESCWYGFSGLLMPDGSIPQPIYYAYKFYADLTEDRYAIQDAVPGISVISGDLEKGGSGILIGNYGTETRFLSVELSGVNSKNVTVTTHKVPNTSNKVVPLADIHPITTTQNPVIHNTLRISVESLTEGEVYFIEVTP